MASLVSLSGWLVTFFGKRVLAQGFTLFLFLLLKWKYRRILNAWVSSAFWAGPLHQFCFHGYSYDKSFAVPMAYESLPAIVLICSVWVGHYLFVGELPLGQWVPIGCPVVDHMILRPGVNLPIHAADYPHQTPCVHWWFAQLSLYPHGLLRWQKYTESYTSPLSPCSTLTPPISRIARSGLSSQPSLQLEYFFEVMRDPIGKQPWRHKWIKNL